MEGNGPNFSPLVHEGCYPGEGGYSQINWERVCGQLAKTLTLFKINIGDFPYAFYDLTRNLIPRLRPYLKLILSIRPAFKLVLWFRPVFKAMFTCAFLRKDSFFLKKKTLPNSMLKCKLRPKWPKSIPYSWPKRLPKPVPFRAAHNHVPTPPRGGEVVIRECLSKDVVWAQEDEWDHSTTEDKSRVVAGLRICNKYICINEAP